MPVHACLKNTLNKYTCCCVYAGVSAVDLWIVAWWVARCRPQWRPKSRKNYYLNGDLRREGDGGKPEGQGEMVENGGMVGKRLCAHDGHVVSLLILPLYRPDCRTGPMGRERGTGRASGAVPENMVHHSSPAAPHIPFSPCSLFLRVMRGPTNSW